MLILPLLTQPLSETGGRKGYYSHLICSDPRGFTRRTFRTNCTVTRALLMKLICLGDNRDRVTAWSLTVLIDLLIHYKVIISLKFSLFYYATLNLLNTFLNATRSTITQQIEIFKVVFNKSLYMKINVCFPFIRDTVSLRNGPSEKGWYTITIKRKDDARI